MSMSAATPVLHQLLVEGLYCDMMLLADEAQDYAAHHARLDAKGLDPYIGVTLSCELLRLTTRVTYVLAWLLDQRCIAAGERAGSGSAPALADLPNAAPEMVACFPPRAAELIDLGQDLYRRALLLAQGTTAEQLHLSPARALQQRLTITLRG